MSDAADVVPRYERWLHAVVNSRGHVDAGGDHHDLVQEGRIAIWRAMASFDREKGTEAGYVVRVAERRMADLLRRGRPWTGQPSRRGRDSHHDMTTVATESFDEDGPELDVAGPDDTPTWAMAYHRSWIHRAVESLPDKQRDYVVLRFWHGKSDREIQAELGLPNDPGYLWRDRRSGARVRLREALSELGDAA